MARGLPISIILHVVALTVIATYGTYVAPPPLEPTRILRVQLASLPQSEPEPEVQAPPPEPEAREPEPVAEPARPEPEPELPPKEVPQAAPQKKPEPEKKPEKKPEPPAPRPEPADEPPVEAAAAPTEALAGPTVSGTDVDFPFAWYLGRVESIIAGKWNPRQLGFREGTSRRCAVHFLIGRRGEISQVAIVERSGVDLFDREALRAVKASRLPPLPAKFSARQLGVTFIFTLQSGI